MAWGVSEQIRPELSDDLLRHCLMDYWHAGGRHHVGKTPILHLVATNRVIIMHSRGIRYVFTGEIVQDDDVYAVFIKSAFWGPISRMLDATGISPALRVHESEKDCVLMIRDILAGVGMHGHSKDLEGYRDAWKQIRRRKTELGLPLDDEWIPYF